MRFSVIIPCYDNAEYLSGCLDSLLAQTFPDWEAVVVVDGSPDECGAIAKGYAARDARIAVIDKPQNEGTHRARMSGVEAARGEYAVFLDPDDRLLPGALADIDAVLAKREEAEPVDIFHYGMRLYGTEDISEEDCRAVEAYGNQAFPELRDHEICDAAFHQYEGAQQDWRVVQRVFRMPLLKEAFSVMSDERLGRGQDSYEYFVIATMARNQVTMNDLVGYEYHYGRGVTNTSELDAADFIRTAEQIQANIDAVRSHAETLSGLDVSKHLDQYRYQMLVLLTNDWHERVVATEKDEAAARLVDVIGACETATHLARFARDDAYRDWDTNAPFRKDAEYVRWIEMARALEPMFGDEDTAAYDEFLLRAQQHCNDLRYRTEQVSDARKKGKGSLWTRLREVLSS